MNRDKLDSEIILEFWKKNANQKSNRWTSQELLKYELNFCSRFKNNETSILNLGSGSGDLSRNLASNTNKLTAVDYIDTFSRHYTKLNHKFINFRAHEFSSTNKFDLILLFGIISYLTKEQEARLYKNVSTFLSSKGVFIVKNQFSRSAQKIVNSYSKKLNSQYSARYPLLLDTTDLLKVDFKNLEIHNYPEHFNEHNDTYHSLIVVR
jgi:2-polyprenyl-3-methyl-5-hydroxy-6-metoxy-1,4-benzoquinol methylase